MNLRRIDIVVFAVLGLLATGFVVSAVANAREQANRNNSKNNLRTIGGGFQSFVGLYGFFPSNGGPPMEVVTSPNVRTGFPDSEAFRWGYADPKRVGRLQTGSWAYAILPHIGEEETFRKVDHTRAVPAYYIGTRRETKPQSVPKADPIYEKWTYQDAGLGPWGRTDYAANDQVIRGGMGNTMKPEQVKDGLAETFLAGEKAMDSDAVKTGGWYWDEPFVLGGSGGTGRKGDRLMRDAPKLVEDVADNWGSPDAAGVWFLFCDGHIRLFKYDTPSKQIAAMISPNRNDAAELP